MNVNTSVPMFTYIRIAMMNTNTQGLLSNIGFAIKWEKPFPATHYNVDQALNCGNRAVYNITAINWTALVFRYKDVTN